MKSTKQTDYKSRIDQRLLDQLFKDFLSNLDFVPSRLTVNQHLQKQGLSAPVRFLDTKEDAYIAQTDTLNVDCLFCTDGEELYEGMTIIISVTDPTQKDKYGKPWKDRMAFAYSVDWDWPPTRAKIDFDWN